jgi:gas vesicle protein
MVMGMLAGSVIGAAAAIIAMPYIQPQIKRAVRRGGNVIKTQMDKMTEPSA